MNLVFWIIIFAVSLYALIKGADLFVFGAEKIGLRMGLSPFVIGVTIVAIGTSFPELFVSLAAGFKGVTEAITATVIGSNIANILLIGGLSAIIGKKLIVNKSLIDIELPLLSIGTVIFLSAIWPWNGGEAVITRAESVILILAYVSYLLYTISYREGSDSEKSPPAEREKLSVQIWVALFVGIGLLVLGSKFLIDSVVEMSKIIGIAVEIITILAVAVGTSLPELVVSVRAAFNKKFDIAIGNIIGSNTFNSFMVIGIPGLFTTIGLDQATFIVGVPMLILTTFLFVISGISNRIHSWEGILYVFLYVFFVGKILNIL
ncbi:MAG: calcium/sodium antiporter [Minisyncoccales bacterium]|jgi:cation:H+ antiporter